MFLLIGTASSFNTYILKRPSRFIFASTGWVSSGRFDSRSLFQSRRVQMIITCIYILPQGVHPKVYHRSIEARQKSHVAPLSAP